MFKTIVVAIDGSEPSLRAVDAACNLAKAFDGEVHLVQALENRQFDPDPSIGANNGDGSSGPEALEMAAAHAADHGVIPATQTVGEGEAAEEIMTIADLYSADLIVMGRRGLGNLKSLISGSTSQQIAKTANCGVLTVK